jgi:hypothetical protein
MRSLWWDRSGRSGRGQLVGRPLKAALNHDLVGLPVAGDEAESRRDGFGHAILGGPLSPGGIEPDSVGGLAVARWLAFRGTLARLVTAETFTADWRIRVWDVSPLCIVRRSVSLGLSGQPAKDAVTVTIPGQAATP